MGEYTTQKRTLDVLPTMRKRVGDTGSWTVKGTLPSALNPSQQTESYRTKFETGSTLSESEIRDFLTVTYNGLRQANPNYDTGHEFFTTKTWWRCSHPDWKIYHVGSTGVKEYRKGPLIPLNNSATSPKELGYYPDLPRMPDTEVNTKGARAINAVQPAQSSAKLATFLGELLEDIPQMIGVSLLRDRTEVFHSLGGEYLNIQFGWAPFVSDIRNILNAVKSSHKICSQYARDSGRVVRRRFQFPTEVSSTKSDDIKRSSSAGPLWSYNGDNPSWITSAPQSVYLESITSRDIWFSGAFTYYLNPGNSLLGRLERYSQLADHLLGLEITPAVLWELTPWSWLIDWVGDIGVLLANTSAIADNGLVMKYGYLMCHTRSFNRFTIPTGVTFNGNIKTGPIYTIYGRETKERRKATPYGFGLDPGSFSAFQWSILGALGMTKAPGILH